MNRRSFLKSSIQAGLTASIAGTVSAQTLDSNPSPSTDSNAPPAAMIGEKAIAGYFTEQRLHQALGTDQLRKPTDVQVVAFNYPGWHPSKYMENLFGKGWTEFDTLRNARTLFPGHSMPHYPLWGYFDESDPAWSAKEIDLASSHGVDAWMIDWYWYQGTQLFHEQLERGFLKAENRAKLKFAIMWANVDWPNLFPAESPGKAAVLLPQTLTFAEFENVLNYCAEHYFSQPNYLRIDDAPVFALFDAQQAVKQLGVDGLRRALQLMRDRAAKLGFPKLHLQVCLGYDPYEKQLHDLGFDSATQYGTMGWTYGGKPPGSRIPYGVGAVEGIASWQEKRANLSTPFFPCCQVGWDDSPRYAEYASIAIDRTPDQFERLVRAARHFIASAPHTKMIYIAAWNEWTEDHVLLPDTYWGYSYLEALQRAVKG
jgi:hypothetical protein